MERKKEERTAAAIKALQQGGASSLQYEALELFITESTKASIRAKKTIQWFLRQTNYLQRDIALTIAYKEGDNASKEFVDEVAHGIHDMSNMLFAIFNVMGLPKTLSYHYGVATKVTESLIEFQSGWDTPNQQTVPMMIDGNEVQGCTIWFAPKFYQREVQLLDFNAEAIEKTKLRQTYFMLSASDTSSPNVHCLTPEFYEDDKLPKRYMQVKKQASTAPKKQGGIIQFILDKLSSLGWWKVKPQLI